MFGRDLAATISKLPWRISQDRRKTTLAKLLPEVFRGVRHVMQPKHDDLFEAKKIQKELTTDLDKIPICLYSYHLAR